MSHPNCPGAPYCRACSGGLRIGALFAGYGGLEMGVQSVLGGEIAWHSEIDKGACKVLAHRYPGVPNLGDITKIDWSRVPRVHGVTLGFPCQDVSGAGVRKGLEPGTRSGLWTHAAYAIDQLRPEFVVIENVRGLLSADAHHPAHGNLEPCPWCVGDGRRRPLRALGAVLGDLADLGYDARWHGLRAADVGAPHGRFRVFVVAYPNGAARDQRRVSAPGQAESRGAWADAGGRDRASAADTVGLRGERRREHGDLAGPSRAGEGDQGQRQRDGDAVDDRGAVAADSNGRGLEGLWLKEPAGLQGARRREFDGRDLSWGQYEPAVRRWKRLTRPAPAPTEPGRNGQPRLSPAFVEWLMGLPAGWVTDVPGVTRNEALKMLGNGVVPAQAAEALRRLLKVQEAAA